MMMLLLLFLLLLLEQLNDRSLNDHRRVFDSICE